MVKIKEKKFPWLWIIIPLMLAMVVFVIFSRLLIINLPQSQSSSTKDLKFTNIKNEGISREEAVTTVKSLSEVKEYLKRVPNGLISVNGEGNDTYMVQVYEIKDGHTATFNWYSINKTTGKIEKEF